MLFKFYEAPKVIMKSLFKYFIKVSILNQKSRTNHKECK